MSSNYKARSPTLAQGVQSLTALFEAQTPSSKIESQIAALQSALSSQGHQRQSYNASAYVPLGDGAPNTIAAASNIGNVSGAAITNLTASEIPDFSGSYLSLNGGAVTGTTSFSLLSVGSSKYVCRAILRTGNTTPSIIARLPGITSSDGGLVIRGNYAYYADEYTAIWLSLTYRIPANPVIVGSAGGAYGASCQNSLDVTGRYAVWTSDCASSIAYLIFQILRIRYS